MVDGIDVFNTLMMIGILCMLAEGHRAAKVAKDMHWRNDDRRRKDIGEQREMPPNLGKWCMRAEAQAKAESEAQSD